MWVLHGCKLAHIKIRIFRIYRTYEIRIQTGNIRHVCPRCSKVLSVLLRRLIDLHLAPVCRAAAAGDLLAVRASRSFQFAALRTVRNARNFRCIRADLITCSRCSTLASLEVSTLAMIATLASSTCTGTFNCVPN